MKIVISSGHGSIVRGARGYPVPPQLDEVDQARRVVETVAEYLRSAAVDVVTLHDNVSTSQSANLNWITSHHNSQGPHDWDVSVHFNAYDGSAHGCEVLYVTQERMARMLAEAISEAGNFTLRGAKYRGDLAFLNNTNEPAVLIETCFCDNTGDSNKYNDSYNNICLAIAERLAEQQIDEQPPVEPPVEPPVTEPPPTGVPQTGTVVNLTAGDTLNIRASSSSSSPIIGKADNNDLVSVVASAYNGETLWYKLKFGDDHMAGVSVYGWASASYIDVEGEVPDAEGEWHSGITATEFGGGSDSQDSAYPDIDWITSSSHGVALPYKWKETPRPQIIVRGPAGEVTTEILDLGPWNTDDPDYCLGSARPLSETQYENGTQAQNGSVPTNDAGIDLTPPVAAAVGVSGKGKVSWRFA
jgi:N-acetylmuramoyl-L-alanine amidase